MSHLVPPLCSSRVKIYSLDSKNKRSLNKDHVSNSASNFLNVTFKSSVLLGMNLAASQYTYTLPVLG